MCEFHGGRLDGGRWLARKKASIYVPHMDIEPKDFYHDRTDGWIGGISKWFCFPWNVDKGSVSWFSFGGSFIRSLEPANLQLQVHAGVFMHTRTM